jgi:hypothetical protein
MQPVHVTTDVVSSSSSSMTLMFDCFMVFNTTFNNISPISWRLVVLREKTGGPGENHRPVTDKLYHLMLYTTTNRHDIGEILLKVVLKTIKQSNINVIDEDDLSMNQLYIRHFDN